MHEYGSRSAVGHATEWKASRKRLSVRSIQLQHHRQASNHAKSQRRSMKQSTKIHRPLEWASLPFECFLPHFGTWSLGEEAWMRLGGARQWAPSQQQSWRSRTGSEETHPHPQIVSMEAGRTLSHHDQLREMATHHETGFCAECSQGTPPLLQLVASYVFVGILRWRRRGTLGSQ